MQEYYKVELGLKYPLPIVQITKSRSFYNYYNPHPDLNTNFVKKVCCNKDPWIKSVNIDKAVEYYKNLRTLLKTKNVTISKLPENLFGRLVFPELKNLCYTKLGDEKINFIVNGECAQEIRIRRKSDFNIGFSTKRLEFFENDEILNDWIEFLNSFFKGYAKITPIEETSPTVLRQGRKIRILKIGRNVRFDLESYKKHYFHIKSKEHTIYGYMIYVLLRYLFTKDYYEIPKEILSIKKEFPTISHMNAVLLGHSAEKYRSNTFAFVPFNVVPNFNISLENFEDQSVISNIMYCNQINSQDEKASYIKLQKEKKYSEILKKIKQ